MVDQSDFPYPLPYLLHVPHADPVWIRQLDANATELHAARRLRGFHVIHPRIYPHNFAHSVRDTLSYDVYAFRRFCRQTWDPNVIAPNLRVVYIDGQKTASEVYAIHTDHPVIEGDLSTWTGLRVVENAVVGHLCACWTHYFSPQDWHAFSDFIAIRLLGHVPPRDPAGVWLANRNPGHEREWLNAEQDIAPLLEAQGFNVFTQKPGLLSLAEQSRAAKQASFIVGPHGSNLVSMILAGHGVAVAEIIASDFPSWWYAQQAVFQAARWVCYPPQRSQATTMGGGRVVYPAAELVQYLVKFFNSSGRASIRCRFPEMNFPPGASQWNFMQTSPAEVSEQACWPEY